MDECINSVWERNTLDNLREFIDFTKVSVGFREAVRDGADPRAITALGLMGRGTRKSRSCRGRRSSRGPVCRSLGLFQ